ncbi:MAG: branched-chain amino acid ABC transporter substrate-binding protein [Gaiellales bacterium]
MFRRLATLLAVLAAAALLAPLAGARPASAERATQGSIILAFQGPLTGAQAANGRDQLRGVKLAVREINRAGGVLGMRILLVAGNDKADAAIGADVAESVAAKGPYAVIGPYNSSVGLESLPAYQEVGVIPMRMTSLDQTSKYGATVQPMNSQISPVETLWMLENEARKVSILWDPSAYTKGMANRMYRALRKQGALVTKIQIDPDATDYTAVVRQALTDNPDTVYVSTYYPQGALIARALKAEADQGNDARCFMGLANQERPFITQAGIAAASRCTFSGVPTPTQFPYAKAKAYVKAYKARYGRQPGTWGIFTYDSVYTLAAAIEKGGALDADATRRALFATKGLAGATGPITIAKRTGNRTDVPVAILSVNKRGAFVLEDIAT